MFPHKSGLKFAELLKPKNIYRGKCFDDIDEMYRKLNIIEHPDVLDYNQTMILLEKRLISIVSIVKEGNKG